MEVRDVVVTGGTGRLGRRMVDRLRAEGIEPRVMSRSGRPGTIKGDLLTGEVIEAAVRGADTIIHAAQSPTRKSRQTAVEGTERLLEIAARGGLPRRLRRRPRMRTPLLLPREAGRREGRRALAGSVDHSQIHPVPRVRPPSRGSPEPRAFRHSDPQGVALAAHRRERGRWPPGGALARVAGRACPRYRWPRGQDPREPSAGVPLGEGQQEGSR